MAGSEAPLDVTDHGDVRTELLEFLERASERAKGIAAVFTLLSNEYFQEGPSTLQGLRAALIAGEKKVAARSNKVMRCSAEVLPRRRFSGELQRGASFRTRGAANY